MIPDFEQRRSQRIMTIKMMRTLEVDVPRAQRLIASLNDSMEDREDLTVRIQPAAAAQQILEELDRLIDREALFSQADRVLEKIASFANSSNAEKLVALRGDLWRFLARSQALGCRAPNGMCEVILQEVRLAEPPINVFTCLAGLPATIIEANAELVMQRFQQRVARRQFFTAREVFVVFEKLPMETIVRFNVEPMIADYALQTRDEILYRRIHHDASDLLANIRAHAAASVVS